MASINPIVEIDRLSCPRCSVVVELPTLTFANHATDLSITAQVIEHNHQVGLKLIEHLREFHGPGLVEQLREELREIRKKTLRALDEVESLDGTGSYATVALVSTLAGSYRELKDERVSLRAKYALSDRMLQKIAYVLECLKRASTTTFIPPSSEGVDEGFTQRVNQLLAPLVGLAEQGREAQRLHNDEPLLCATDKLDRLSSYMRHLFNESMSGSFTNKLADIEFAISAAHRAAEREGQWS